MVLLFLLWVQPIPETCSSFWDLSFTEMTTTFQSVSQNKILRVILALFSLFIPSYATIHQILWSPPPYCFSHLVPPAHFTCSIFHPSCCHHLLIYSCPSLVSLVSKTQTHLFWGLKSPKILLFINIS